MIRHRVYYGAATVIAVFCSLAFWLGLKWEITLILAGLWATSGWGALRLGAYEAQNRHLRRELDIWLRVGGDCRIVFHLPDEEGVQSIKSIGPKVSDILGWSKDEMVGHDWKKFCHPNDLPASTQEAQSVVEGGVLHQYTGRWRHKQDLADGIPQWVWLEWGAFFAPEAKAIFAIFRDVVSYRLDQDARIATWAAITNDLLVVADATIPIEQRKPEWVNSAWTRQLGWLPEELYKMPIIGLLEPTEVPSISAQRAALDQEARPGAIECRVRCKPVVGRPQEYRFYEWASQHLNKHVYATGRDIGRDRLHREQMDKAIEDLEARNADLERFASVTAHQLRSPPRTIAGIAQALREDYGHLLDEAGIQFLDDIRYDAAQMADIVDGIYRFSKVRTQADLVLEPVDLQALVTELIPSCQKDGHCLSEGQLSCHSLPVVLGDKVLLMEVLRNLIDNGYKFNESNPKVVIITADRRTDGRWDITVRDNGIGIPPQYQHKVFEMFQRMHPSYRGTGVGLALVKAIVQKLGGQIILVSGVGQGSAFTFDLEAAWTP